MPARATPDELPSGDIVYGRHPVLAALEGTRSVNKVWVLRDLQNQALVAEIRQLAKLKGASVQMVERPKLDTLTSGANHQGVVVSIAQAEYVEIDVLIARAQASPNPALLMLDGVEDPQNLGALIRTAEGAGFSGVIIPNRRAVGITPVVAKVSAGAVDRVPVARTGNLSQAAELLKKSGFWLVGADAAGESLPYDVDLTVPVVLVIGAEGRGLSRLLATHCDHRVKLPLAGDLESLNASAAGAILMYEAVRQRLMRQSKV
jgi:23S rRNA (guanosine2251-2'-O)-methyltransferase